MTHQIRAGDWIIFEASQPESDFGASEDPIKMMHRAHTLGRSQDLADQAVFVMCATKTHLTIYDPLQGHPIIVQISLLDGVWHYATQVQVEATWTIARKMLPQGMAGMVDMAIKVHPYKPLEGPRT